MRKELTFMEAIQEAKKGKEVYMLTGIEDIPMKIVGGIITYPGFKDETMVQDVEGKWYIDEPEKTLSDKIEKYPDRLNCDARVYHLEDVKEAIKKFIELITEDERRPKELNLWDVKMRLIECVGEELVK